MLRLFQPTLFLVITHGYVDELSFGLSFNERRAEIPLADGSLHMQPYIENKALFEK